MTHYLDFSLRPDPELPPSQLLSALYAKLHRALVQRSDGRIAVSFPGYSTAPPQLGTTLRLIGPEEDLSALIAVDWMLALRDHVIVSPIAAIPAHAKARTLRRVQAKSSPERLRRRQMRRHGFTEEEVVQRIPDTATEMLRLPYLHLASASTGQKFRLFLRLGEPQSSNVSGEFNTYGLSTTATIPWF
ncbi:type I-F CRISPR-associated endoribonuclease Cas6/Csy4 [Rhodocyclus gracilis]|uniref:Type I-F CRISPR-associated endoribonuclease Cas6/Csy4 n=1 Tax=Rhodocyclus tenuis TaxID=1066 RepID=A0A6L5JV92_RHOTE|nr:type I-F CRISPR-associated endoribonuclease Cas6/Csy4 [Rhodocyclus gracilis]MQY51285.1 type I-F CRISPR-associated endoribonuclease Cas6/Csy4 [Rhodocyclus gracilis]